MASAFTRARFLHTYPKHVASALFPRVRFQAPSGIPTLSQKLLFRAGLVKSVGSGLSALMPLGVRAIEKLTAIVDAEMLRIRASKVSLPSIIPASFLQTTGRWTSFGEELFRLEDRHKSNLCLGPTHEEVITKLVAENLLSFRQLPIRLYQIGNKYRDELKPRMGLLRGREFLMKDLYTFDTDDKSAQQTYEEVCEAYHRIFSSLNLPYVRVEGSTGQMGGFISHEYQLPADIGEDTICACSKCKRSWSEDIWRDLESKDQLPVCSDGNVCQVEKRSAIEIGHAFLLGTTYSEPFKAAYACQTGEKSSSVDMADAVMGCFGIGLSRILAAALEVKCVDEKLVWPHRLAPYSVHIVSLGQPQEQATLFQAAEELYNALLISSHCDDNGQNHILCRDDVLLEDRLDLLSAKQRLIETSCLGFPYVIFVGRKFLQCGLYELQYQPSRKVEFLPKDKLVHRLNELLAHDRGLNTTLSEARPDI